MLPASGSRPHPGFAYSCEQENWTRLPPSPTCNGYPSGAKVPAAWREDPRRRCNTSLQGLSNKGHDEGIFLRNKQEIYAAEEKSALIMFLKTL